MYAFISNIFHDDMSQISTLLDRVPNKHLKVSAVSFSGSRVELDVFALIALNGNEDMFDGE